MSATTGYFVSNLSALRAIGASGLVAGMSKLVLNPGDDQPPAWYNYSTSINYNADDYGNSIIRPNHIGAGSAGRWIKESHHIINRTNNTFPTPRFLDAITIVKTGSRTILFKCFTPNNTGGNLPYGNGVVVKAISTPDFTPDYVGQKLWCSTSNEFYVAEGTGDSTDFKLLNSTEGGGS